jgi:hypothetical protein
LRGYISAEALEHGESRVSAASSHIANTTR